MNEDGIIKLQHFFAVDTKIKKEMYAICPPNDGGYLDNNSLIKYTDSLNESLIYMFSELKCIVIDLFGSRSLFYKKVDFLERNIKTIFYECGIDINKLRSFYKNYISDMNPKFIDSVKSECVGYTDMVVEESINMANSINELLHLLHACILNDERILEKIPLIHSKENNYSYPINLRGANVPIFNQLFLSFPLDMDCGWTEMVIVNERKLLMMIRDRGHALSMEISIINDSCRIEYFIPKLCNIEMINRLPGVNKVSKDSVGATGIMEVKLNDLSASLFEFISKVPMDSDIVYENTSSIGNR